MAGARYSLSINHASIQAALNELLKRGQNLKPAMMEIGEELLISHNERFSEQKAPDGTPWAPLSETTKSIKTKNVDTILVFNDFLRSTLNYEASADGLSFGSPMEYAAMQQFGGTTAPNSMIPNKEIVARPFLGVDSDDTEMILETLSHHLMNGIESL